MNSKQQTTTSIGNSITPWHLFLRDTSGLIFMPEAVEILRFLGDAYRVPRFSLEL